MHHVYDEATLAEAYNRLKRDAAAGVDGVSWSAYGENLAENLRDLSGRLRRGAYRARPVRRVFIDKEDGGQRPLGVTCIEDKIVQGAVTLVLNAIYETDFLGFSYGFRPGRSQHNALDAVTVGIQKKKVNWVLDADVRGYFDAIDHAWLVKFVEHRIGDRRVIRLIQKWLKAGVLEDGIWACGDTGTPQGGGISPLLANIYLHYALDLWADHWRRRSGIGDVIVVRYADDVVFGLQHRGVAVRFLADLRERLARFGLQLHPEKTRLIEFGRFAAQNRRDRGEGKPETFNFLGLVHYCGRTRQGWFTIKRRTMRRRLQAKLKEVKCLLMQRRHEPVPEVGSWLRSVMLGHYRYYGVPHNIRALRCFYDQIVRHWRHALSRRSQKGAVTWERMHRLKERWLPRPRIYHPFPNQRLCVAT
jgi:group II intron reverse transcriptase/maturase